MKQNKLTFVLTILLSMVGQQALADWDYNTRVQMNGLYYYLDKANIQAQVAAMPSGKYTGDIVIPFDFIYKGKTYSVTSIGYGAFWDCSGLTSVTIPNSVTSIGESAFRSCSDLTSISIPNSVTSIGKLAFNSCSGLTSVTIPNSVTSIGESAFRSCKGLTSIAIPNSVTSIGESAFSGCSGLTSITIPNSVTSISRYAFSGCSSLTSVTIPNNITTIGDEAFNGCSGLTSVTIGNSVTSIGTYAFSGCSNLTSVTLNSNAIASEEYALLNSLRSTFGSQVTAYILGEDVTSIGVGAFRYCSNLTSVTISNSVTTIGRDVFYGCSGLTSITIPNSVTSIGDHAFSGCSGLTSVVIPNSVTSIGSGAFNGCSGLTKVIVRDIATLCGISFGNNSANPLYYAHHLYSDENTEIRKLVIPDDVTSIGYGAFLNCPNLTSVTIPNSLTSIGSSAFEGCSGLTSVTIPNSVINIGNNAFKDCTGLTLVTINSNTILSNSSSLNNIFGALVGNYILGDGITSVGENAFSGCSGMNSITIPSSITNIGTKAFYNCTSLQKVIVKDIAAWCSIIFGDNPLHYAKRLYSDENTEITNLVIPDNVKNISSFAFYNCSNLTSLTIPNNVTSIGEKAFMNCSSMASVTINNNTLLSKTYSVSSSLKDVFGTQVSKYIIGNDVASIGENAFNGCTGMNSILIPNSVTSIGENAFYGCTGMDSFTIPNSVTNIGNSTFSGCSNMNSISIPNSVTNIGDNAFYGCSSLSSIIIPNSVTNIGSNAFSSCVSLSTITIPNSVTKIGDNTFAGCSRLKVVTIDSNDVMLQTFTSSFNLSSIFGSQVQTYIIGDNVTDIGTNTFNGCKGMSSIIIPNSVTSIGSNAFDGCTSLKSVTVNSNTIMSQTFTSSYNLSNIFGGQVQTYNIGDNVTVIGAYTFYSCKNMTSVNISNSVTSIGSSAFYKCSSLKSITIPNSISNIGSGAFCDCSGLTKVVIKDIASWCNIPFDNYTANPLYNAKHIYSDENTEITNLVIPDNVTSIGGYAFYNCNALTSITLPKSIKNIGRRSFYNCNNIKKVIIKDMDVAAWCDIDFLSAESNPLYYATHLYSDENTEVTNIIIPDNVTKIGSYAFVNCNTLTVSIPEGMKEIGQNAFSGSLSIILSEDIAPSLLNSNALSPQLKYYVGIGTKSLLRLWNCDYKQIFAKDTNKELVAPSLMQNKSTQTTIEISIKNKYDGYTYTCNDEPLNNSTLKLTGLRPSEGVDASLMVSLNDVSYSPASVTFYTSGLFPSVSKINTTASSLQAKGYYYEDDAVVTKKIMRLNDVTTEGDYIYVHGLQPGKKYKVEYIITVKYGKDLRESYDYIGYENIATSSLTLKTLQPKTISVGNVNVSAETNFDLEDTEMDVGFEWRRIDWTDEFQSNVGKAYLYEGIMDGIIRNLYTEKLWKVRPYYRSNEGQYYYGDWVGIDPVNTSYFEPTVHTYARPDIIGNTVHVKGYVLNGTDIIESQGFRYWKSTNNARSSYNEQSTPDNLTAITVPVDAQTIETVGDLMEATLSNLDYDAMYNYVAFAKTTEGTFYGEVKTFATGDQASGIENISYRKPNEGDVYEVARYNLQGKRINSPERGINIIRMSNGTTKKVVVK